MNRIINRTLLLTRRLTINLVTYSEGHRVSRHLDMIESGRYYKLNFILWNAKRGGEFKTEGVIFSLLNRIILFRPDLYEHSVSEIEQGKRVLLSFALHIPERSIA